MKDRRSYVSLATAANRTGLSERTLRRYIAAGRLTGYRVGPRLVRLDVDEVDSLMRPIPAVGHFGGDAA